MRSWIVTIVIMTNALILSGCNGLAGPEHGEPYLVLKGKITNEKAVPTPQNMRVALLWINEEPEDENPYSVLKVAQETEVNAEFPSFFQLSVNELPPEDAMMNLHELEDEFPPDRSVALGAIIVYHDGNNNHELDLIPSGATESVDTVLGVPMDLLVIYLEGEPFEFEDEGGETIRVESGFNLLELTSEEALEACQETQETCMNQAQTDEEYDLCFDQMIDCMNEAEAQDPPETIPLDTQIVIDLDSDPRLARMLCEYTGLEGEGGSSGGHGDFDITDPDTWPDSMEIICSEDGRSFDYYWEEDHSTLCYSSSSGGAGSFGWIPGEPLPEWWPCEEP